MILVNVYSLEGDPFLRAVSKLYDILAERPLDHGISHKSLPSFAEHEDFVRSIPFRYWYLIQGGHHNDDVYIGAIECLPTNEFGIHLLELYQGCGFGRQAVELFLSTHEPLPAIPAIRNGHWLANVAPANERAKEFFEKLGFHKIQETFELSEEEK